MLLCCWVEMISRENKRKEAISQEIAKRCFKKKINNQKKLSFY